MKYNRPYSRARWGTMAKDFELGVNFDRLRRERLAKAQAAIKARGLGAILCFDMDSVRYICGTTILDVFRDFMTQYCICPAEGRTVLFDSAVPAKRISAPWMEDRLMPPLSVLKGALPPETDVPSRFARQVKKILVDYGVEKQPLGIDLMEFPMQKALEKEGITLADGVQAILDAREIKTADEIELLKPSPTASTMRCRGRSGRASRNAISSRSPRGGFSSWARNAWAGSRRWPGPGACRIPTHRPIGSSSPGTWSSSIRSGRSWAIGPVTTAAMSAASRTSTRKKPTNARRSG
jgi:hypothetical protein